MDPLRFSVRATTSEEGGTRIYVRKKHFDVGLPLSFDMEYPGITALEYLLGAIAGDLISGLKDLARKQRIQLDNIEAVLQAELQNPLTHLGVIGEEGNPGLQTLTLKVYVDTLVEEAAVRRVWDEVQRRSPMWHTFRSLVRFDCQLVITQE